MASLWVGADPGGDGNFGLAFLHADSDRATATTVSSVEEAVKRIAEQGEPRGLGIEAPMWWSTRPGGGRKVDQKLRDKYKIHPGTVQSANSLAGAVLVGGAMLAYRVRERFPHTRITEAHSKALLGAGFQCLLKCVKYDEANANEHKRDALIAAICAREGFEKRWGEDLAKDRWPEEQDPLSPCFWLSPVHYFWPESVSVDVQ
jgi:hypothetical protein